MNNPKNTFHQQIAVLLKKSGLISSRQYSRAQEIIDVQPLHGDGSSRYFLRVFVDCTPLCIAVFPGLTEVADLSEARAAVSIGTHLYNAGITVPEILASEMRQGLILFEDLGDVRLHDRLQQGCLEPSDHYQEIIPMLVRMQVVGARQFDQRWCYDSPTYDKQVMLERESGYFFRAFWQDTLYGESIVGLQEEFTHLADQASLFCEPFFLHRDFQSRNIMIKDGNIRIIDFQAGRLGPPGYDLASLLIDPYAALPDETQDELLQGYLEETVKYPEVDSKKIRLSYPYLAVQRNLQIIGAFSFLSGKKRKPFFLPYIFPSLISLQNRLTTHTFDSFPILRRTVSKALLKYRSQIRG